MARNAGKADCTTGGLIIKHPIRALAAAVIFTASLGAIQNASAVTIFNVGIDLDSPDGGGVGNPGAFISYDFNFDIAVGDNELVLEFLNMRHIELTGLDAVRTAFWPGGISNMSAQFGDGNGNLIGPSWVMTGNTIWGNENVVGAVEGLDIVAYEFHLFFTAPAASTNEAGRIVFDVNERGNPIGSIAVGGLQIPEPGTLAILSLGLAGMCFTRRRKQAA